MTNLLRDMKIVEVSLVAQGADPDAHVVLVKSAAEVTPEEKSPMADLNPDLAKILEGVEGADALSDELVAALNSYAGERPTGGADVTTAEVEVEVEVETAAEPQVSGGEDIMTIAAENDVVKSNDSSDSERDDVAKRLADVEAELAKERESRETRDLVEKVKVELPSLVVDAEDVASVLFRIGKGRTTGDDAAKVLDVLKRASIALAEAGTFVEKGTSQTDEEGGMFGKMVADFMREDSSLTRQQAISKALRTDEGRKLYEETHAPKA